jgi:hypothetical protein
MKLLESPRESQTFEALLLSLPARHSTVRMRLWRALKSTGCGVLRDGVYILPAGTQHVATLKEVEAEVKAAGGFAITVELNVNGSAELAHVRKLFDRNVEYGTLVDQLDRTKASLRRLGKRKAETAIQRLRRSCEELVAIDFYPGEAQLQTKDALSSLELESNELFAEGEPHTSKARVRRLDPTKYRGRMWATRKTPWIDRLASAWLIKRFIDKNARFVWIDRPRDCPKRAIGFDFDGADFTHAGHRVTYEVLLASFGLAQDQALASIGAAVHYLDIGGIAIADAKGLETLLMGMRKKTRSDDDMMREAAKIFDLFYAAYSQTPED